MAAPEENLRFVDFSLPPEGPSFEIAPDVFRCYPEIPLDVMMGVADALTDKGEESRGIKRFLQVLDLLAGIMEPMDYDKFIARTKKGTAERPNPNPIGIRHMMKILPWVLEVYGLRPTQESSTSVDGSDADGTSSTEPVSEPASTS